MMNLSIIFACVQSNTLLFAVCALFPVFLLPPLLPAFLLDTLLGDPRKLPHPVRWFGSAIAFFEKHWNKGSGRKLRGSLLAIGLICMVWSVFYLITHLLEPFRLAGYLFAVVCIFYGLANRSLISEALDVERKLTREGVEAGRKRLSWIVGRDTSQLNATQIRTAVLETLAENLSDGVIAPLFYYAVGGVPLMFAYKMINTLDSMIGYKNDRYRDFGWFAARTDDVFNYIPARITAFLMLMVTCKWQVIPFIIRYGKQHASPNSGYPEAAMAGILKCRFGGPNVYHGAVVEKPYIGCQQREITPADIHKACRINFAVTVAAVAIIAALHFFIFKPI